MSAAPSHQQIQIELHRKLAPQYAIRYGFPFSKLFQEEWHTQMFAEMPPDTGAALDIGCGTGFFLADVRKHSKRAVGLDISYDMLQLAQKELPDTYTTQGDAENLPFTNASFDVVFCKGSLHHTRDHDSFLKGCFRVLRSGGVLIISEPCNDNPIIRFARFVLYRVSSRFHPDDEGFRENQLVEMVKNAGFEVARSRKFGVLAYTFAGFPDHLGILKYIPGNVFITKGMIKFDRMLCAIPVLRAFGFHVICTARRPRGS
ncbi:MAG: class I SAM-dependent methyltransferase [Planctomycetes bacterium]|nr:class I SAM-dependent methyltransferase [Planctomycetota bacterium]